VVTWTIVDQAQTTDIVAAIYGSAGQEVVAPFNVTSSPGVGDVIFRLGHAGRRTRERQLCADLAQAGSSAKIDDIFTAILRRAGQQVLAPQCHTKRRIVEGKLRDSPRRSVFQRQLRHCWPCGVVDRGKVSSSCRRCRENDIGKKIKKKKGKKFPLRQVSAKLRSRVRRTGVPQPEITSPTPGELVTLNGARPPDRRCQ